MVHVYGHHNSGELASTLTPLSSLNLRLDALVEHIMVSLILSSATRNTIAVIFSDPYGLPSVSICGVPVHSNLTQSIAYKISKRRLLQYWSYRNLTHMSDWEGIDLTSFKRACGNTTVHMAHLVTKFTSNTLSTMKILQQRGHATTNIYLRCCLAPAKIQHMYQ